MKHTQILTILALAAMLATTTLNAQIWNIGSPNETDVTATLSNDTLTIRGTGKMKDFGSIPRIDYLDTVVGIVIIENGVTSIGERAFLNCSGLTSITIPNSVTSIGSEAFVLCSGLTAIDVESGNTKYSSENGVLFDKAKDTLLLYPQGKQGAYYVIPNGVTSIEAGAFSVCDSLTSVTIPNSVITIGNAAFSGCSGLTSITIPNSVTSIGSYAFSGCSGLTSVTIPNSVTSIGAIEVFNGCSGLTAIDVESANPRYSSVDGVLFDKTKDTLLLYPHGKQGAYIIPNNVTIIEGYAFYYCSGLTQVTIGSGVTAIREAAFMGCVNLKTVISLRFTPPRTRVALSWQSEIGCLYVPAEALLIYSNALERLGWEFGEWSAFECIKSIEELRLTVTFNCNGGTSVDSQTIVYGEKATKPTNPTRTDYLFDGWYKDSTCVNLWDFDTDVVTANLTLFAKWNEKSSVAKNEENHILSVFPNPVVDELRITNYKLRMTANSHPLSIEIYDLNGKCVYSAKPNSTSSIVNSTFTIGVSHLPAGTYIVKIGERSAKIIKR